MLALALSKELDERIAATGSGPEWGDAVRELDRLEQVAVDQIGKRF